MTSSGLLVNRAPVLTLWAAIVAERLGHPRPTALTLGKAVAGRNAQSKGRRLGIYEAPAPAPPGAKLRKPAKPATDTILLLGRTVPVVRTPEGLRAAAKGTADSPLGVERYLSQKFGAALPEVESAMRALARSYPPKRLADLAFTLYEQFRPDIPAGLKGWGARGRLDPARIRSLAKTR
jgi:hypothetical protein